MRDKFTTLISKNAVPLWEISVHDVPQGHSVVGPPKCPRLWDVGYFTDNGGFTPIFNIASSVEDNLLMGFKLPPDFQRAGFLTELPTPEVQFLPDACCSVSKTKNPFIIDYAQR